MSRGKKETKMTAMISPEFIYEKLARETGNHATNEFVKQTISNIPNSQMFFDDLLMDALVRIFTIDHFDENFDKKTSFIPWVLQISELVEDHYDEWCRKLLSEVMSHSAYPILKDLAEDASFVEQLLDDFQIGLLFYLKRAL